VELERPVYGVGSAVMISSIRPVGGKVLPLKMSSYWWRHKGGTLDAAPEVHEPASIDWRTGKWAPGLIFNLELLPVPVYVYNVPFDATLTAARKRLEDAGMDAEHKKMLCDMIDMAAHCLRNRIRFNIRNVVYVDKSIPVATERDDDTLVRYVSDGSTVHWTPWNESAASTSCVNDLHVFLMHHIDAWAWQNVGKHSGGDLNAWLSAYKAVWAFDRGELEFHTDPTTIPETFDAWWLRSLIGPPGNPPEGTILGPTSVFLAYSRFLAAALALPFRESFEFTRRAYFVYFAAFMSHLVTIIVQNTNTFKVDNLRMAMTGRLEYDPETTAQSATQTIAEICKCLSKFLPDPDAVREFSSVLNGLQILHNEKFSQGEGRGRPISWKSTYVTWLSRGRGESVAGYLTVKWPWVEELVDHVMSLQRDPFRAQIRGFHDVTVM